MRRLAAVISLLALVFASTAVAAQRDPRAEKEQLTVADNRLARAIAVRRSDLAPGWTSFRLPADDGERCRSFNPDLSAFTITGKARSGWIDPLGQSVVSLVEVYASRAQAVGDFAAAAKPAAAGCLREALASGVTAGMSFRVVSARMMRAPNAGDRAAAYRLVASVSGNGVRVKLYLDVVVVQRGRSIVALMLTGVQQPVSRRDELARIVAARMR